MLKIKIKHFKTYIKINNITYFKIKNPKLYKNYIKVTTNNLTYNYYSKNPKYVFNNIL
jgi:hypothetical protein